MPKFELLSDGMTYKGSFFRKGSVIDFDDDIDVKGLEEAGQIGPEGTLEKRAEETEKVEAERADWDAEKAARDRELATKQAEAQAGEHTGESSTPNVASQDGPKVAERSGSRRR